MSSLKRESVVCRGGGLTWGGDAVPVLRHVVVQGEEHHPHGQSEHTRQETVENQVEQQDEGWREGGEWRDDEGQEGPCFIKCRL